MSFIRSLTLNRFRSYHEAGLDDLKPGFIVLTGDNGAGKTNVLEAVSLLSPGRGLRNAEKHDWQNRDARQAPWAIASVVETAYGPIPIGTGHDPVKDKRIIRIKGEKAKSQADLAEYLSCVWLTPQMDRIFIDGSAARRRFFDRMLFAFDPAHAGRITRYENALSQRAKILKEGGADPAWLSGLEQQMAETGVAVAAARRDFLEKLQHYAGVGRADNWPAATLNLRGFIENALANAPALAVEQDFRIKLRSSRDDDARLGGARDGPHKTDLVVVYQEKNMPADQCSTGEQKALLFSLVLAHARMIGVERGAPPLLLLDEVAAHLDSNRRGVLFETLAGLNGQVWVTGTDEKLFENLSAQAQFFQVRDAKISRL